jgi:hypothetical protein
MLKLPSKGFLEADASHMVDPAKMGRVMWARTPSGEMAPLDLHGQISVQDLRNLNRIYDRLRMYRKVSPALEAIRNAQWDSVPIIKPYLLASTENRSEAREMKAIGEWEPFWNSIN